MTGTREHFDRHLRMDRLRVLESGKFTQTMGIRTVHLDDSIAILEMDVEDKLNGFGMGHGGAVFTLADQAFALLANACGVAEVAMSATITYLRPAKGMIRAECRRVAEGARTAVYRVDVFTGTELVATFQGTSYKMPEGWGDQGLEK